MPEGPHSAIDQRVTDIERAFQLAKSGTCSSIEDIKKRLKLEGRSVEQITGHSLAKQLKALIKGAASN